MITNVTKSGPWIERSGGKHLRMLITCSPSLQFITLQSVTLRLRTAPADRQGSDP